MVEHIKVNNKTNKMVVVHSFDGDSCHVPGNAVNLPIETKFNWRLPPEVYVVTDTVVSQHIKNENEKPEAISNIAEATKRAAARRNKDIGIIKNDEIRSSGPVSDSNTNPTPIENEPKDHGVSPSTVKGVAVLNK